MSFENLDITNGDMGEPESPPPEESGNRMFLIAAGVLGAIALIALICIAVYSLVLLPRRREAQAQQKATLDVQNTEVALIIANTSTAAAMAAIQAAYTNTPTITPIPPTATASLVPTASPTSVLAVSTATTGATLQPEMATATVLNATLTANAILFSKTLTARPPQATQAIPDTGFADNIGLPAMLGLAILLIAIIFLARRLRTT
jgi:LPXTG-motif cell wall-anchored protein